MEQFKNLAETTLDEALDNSETGIDVVDGSVFPSSGNFRVKVESEIMLCTGRSTNDLTCTRGAEGTTAASHSNGLKIEHVWTKGSYEQSLADLFQAGGYASLPSTSDVRAPTHYRANDVNYGWTFTGTNWDLTHPVYVPYANRVDVSGWSNLNHSTETWTDVNGCLHASGLPTSGGDSIRGYHKAKPSAPFTLHAIINPPILTGAYRLVGFGLYDSSGGKLKFMGVMGNNGLTIFTMNFANTTTYAGDVISRYSLSSTAPFYIQLQDDNTNWIYKFSQNGKEFYTFSEARNSYLTPDKVFLGVDYVDSSLTGNAQWLAYWET